MYSWLVQLNSPVLKNVFLANVATVKKATTVYDQIVVCEKYIKRCCECVCKDKTPFIT
jgi:hypothetical protein